MRPLAHHLLLGPQAHMAFRHTLLLKVLGVGKKRAFQKDMRKLLELSDVLMILIAVRRVGEGGETRQRQKLKRMKIQMRYELSLVTYDLCHPSTVKSLNIFKSQFPHLQKRPKTI